MVTPLDSATDLLSSGLSGILKYWWIVAILVVLAIVAAIVWWIGKFKGKNGQWTHKLNVMIELPNGELDPKLMVFNMRRWKHKDENTPPLFELEKPLIGLQVLLEHPQFNLKQ